MKVCHVTSVHPTLDVRIFHKECNTLTQAGYDVTLLAQADWKEEIVDGVRVIGLPRITKRYQRPRLWRRIAKEVKRLKPDIIHFHNPELLLVSPFLRPAKLIYDCQEANAETMLVRRWIPRPLRYPVSRLVAFLEPTLARWTDAIVVTEDSHVDRFRKGEKPIILLYNYPLLSHFDFEHCSDGKTVIHVGVLSEGRGSITMIEAMNWVVQRVPGARLLLVGPFDSPADEVEVRQLIVDYGLENAVEVVGWVPFTDLPKWFARADAGLVPWHTEEKLPPQIIPTKMFEYMAARLPVVASNRSTIRRFIHDLDCSLLVEPGDSQGFAEAIVYLLNHPAEAKEMGERGRKAVEKGYRWETEGEKLLALYRQLA
jgi:glycosyltransferase involved in cell wall biosynthesis